MKQKRPQPDAPRFRGRYARLVQRRSACVQHAQCLRSVVSLKPPACARAPNGPFQVAPRISVRMSARSKCRSSPSAVEQAQVGDGLLFIVSGERGFEGREIGDIRIEGRHWNRSCARRQARCLRFLNCGMVCRARVERGGTTRAGSVGKETCCGATINPRHKLWSCKKSPMEWGFFHSCVNRAPAWHRRSWAI